MSLQTFINSAQTIEINRSKLVAQTISRSGRLLTASRNWVNPWRFVITPQPIWTWADYRTEFEDLVNADRYAEQTFQLGGSTGSAWLTKYQGANALTSNVLNTATITSFSGTSLVLANCPTNAGYLFKRGDIIQPTGHRYPYSVAADVLATSATRTVTVHRGYITPPATDNYILAGKTLIVGPGCTFYVQISKMPTYRMLPGQRVELTGNLELIEVVV
jgi:hypothetical protein